MNTNLIQSNFKKVLEEIDTCCNLYKRDSNTVKLVVVTKSQSYEKIESVISAGAEFLGENYPEETIAKKTKIQNLSQKIQWHMIGHLQSRKTQMVIDNFHFLHSLDSVKLATRLNRQLKEQNQYFNILLQFNVGGEESKFGWNASKEESWDLLLDDVVQILSCDQLQVKGLMTMPPFTTQEKEARIAFKKLRELGDFLTKKIPDLQITEYSMGTSHDFRMAIAEGSTMIRVGEAIMGPRDT